MPTDALTLSSRIVAGKDQVSANLSGESVILAMQDGVYYGLDAVATRVWNLISEPRALSDVLDVIEREYAVSREQAAEDLLAFADELRVHGLIDVVAA
jgi:hypothetical protein